MDVFEICGILPEHDKNSGIILDNMVLARSKIESPIYQKIICTVSGGGG